MSILTMIANATKATNTATATNEEVIMTTPEVVRTVKKTAMNAQAKASLITQQLYKKGMSELNSVVIAAAFMSIEEELVDCNPYWEDNMVDAIYEANVVASAAGLEVGTWTDSQIEGWKEALVAIDLITADCQAGKFLLQLNMDKELAHARPATQPITAATRRKPTIKNKAKLSNLSKKTLGFLQRNERTISTDIYTLAVDVFDGWGQCDEGYILAGALNQIELGNVPSVNEYFFDTRARIYQGDAHGGNVQASDLARALVSPCHVPMDYDVASAITVLKAEALDMIAGKVTVDQAIIALNAYTPVEFIRLAITKGTKVNSVIKKPWAFYKIAKLISALEAGERPYLDITVGLDAKCSGPQIGALIVGDNKLAAMCGFTETEMEDAYQNCNKMLEARGFVGLDRNLIKKPFMGVFYGQGWMAYTCINSYAAEGKEPTKRQHEAALLPVMFSLGEDLEANAKVFHATVEKSFGAKLCGVRQLLKDTHYHYELDDDNNTVRVNHCDKPTEYFLPDGQKIATQYFIKKTITGSVTDHTCPTPDVSVKVGFIDFKFNQMTFNTKDYDMYSYARTGFVNFIQSLDGLIARLIISKLEDLGATLVDSVHDCFRVTVTDMIDGKLHSAIKFAYNSLFGYEVDHKTQELVYGTDALKMYFEGVNRASMEEYKHTNGQITKVCSQFKFSPRTNESVRNLHKTGMDVQGLINNIQNDLEGTGKTYYFAK